MLCGIMYDVWALMWDFINLFGTASFHEVATLTTKTHLPTHRSARRPAVHRPATGRIDRRRILIGWIDVEVEQKRLKITAEWGLR